MKLIVLEWKLVSCSHFHLLHHGFLLRCYLLELVDSLNVGEVDSIGVEVEENLCDCSSKQKYFSQCCNRYCIFEF